MNVWLDDKRRTLGNINNGERDMFLSCPAEFRETFFRKSYLCILKFILLGQREDRRGGRGGGYDDRRGGGYDDRQGGGGGGGYDDRRRERKLSDKQEDFREPTAG